MVIDGDISGGRGCVGGENSGSEAWAYGEACVVVGVGGEEYVGGVNGWSGREASTVGVGDLVGEAGGGVDD